MLSWLSRFVHEAPTPPAPSWAAELRRLQDDVAGLMLRMRELEAGETQRAMEHAVTLDKLDRFFKRLSARIAREHQGDTESPLTLRRRVRGE